MFYYPPTGKVLVNHSDVRSYLTNTLFGDVITQDQLDYVGVIDIPDPVAPIVEAGKQAILTGFRQDADGTWAPIWDLQDAALEEEDYEFFMQGILDSKAKERRYDGIISLCTYATSTNPKFAAEGQRGVKWRDDFWAFGYDLTAKVKSGELPAPTLTELAAMLPPLEWPE